MSTRSESSDHAALENIESRYEIQRTLGQGGAGIVYQVLDRDTGERLALKKLLRIDLKSVLRLKHEFRALADLNHPNVVKFYDLGRTTDTWFITMEYLNGLDLIAHLRREPDVFTTSRRGTPANDVSAHNLPRLAGAFVQLARGIRALHRAGMLHRDLKPSNVIVADDRVVVLDFGLVRDVGEHAATVTVEDTIAGTPAYMAPEQVQNAVLSEATDWYAFGVMLYEALSGELPISGKLYELLERKLGHDPTPIDRIVTGVPSALATLCMGLLKRHPLERPSYPEIVEVLGSFAPQAENTTQGSLVADQLSPLRQQPLKVLVGREREYAQLQQTFREATGDQLVVVHVRGPAGVGKSALVEYFLDELEREREREAKPVPGSDVLVLRSRCSQREATPFKAIDGLVDSLVDHLARQDELVASHMLPAHLAELARAFPVFARLPAVEHLIAHERPRGDAVLVRTRAELALQDLLRRAAARSSLVLWIDDLQWSDLDSVRVLKSWLESSEALPLFLVWSYQGDELETNACLKLLAHSDTARTVSESVLELAPLSPADVALLCTQTLGEEASKHRALIERIVAEVHGSPFLAWQLLTLAQAHLAQGNHDLASLSIHSLLSQVTALLSDAERSLLNVLAVAGRPMSLSLALRAADKGLDGRSLLHALSSLSLTRTRVVNDQNLVEIYHHRVREAVVGSLTTAERVATYRRLLRVLERVDKADPSWLHLMAAAAEETSAAIHYGREAAEQAAESLAFERAAELYRDCLMRSGAADTYELWRKLGDALAACGRGSRAAEAYLEAAQRASPSAELELTRHAATHFIRSGRFDEGEALVLKVMDGMQLKVPQTEPGLIAAIVWERVRLGVRGLQFRRLTLEEQDPELRLQATTYGSLSIDTQAYDPLRAALFQARSLRIALDVGEPETIATALGSAATMRAVSGSERDATYADLLLDRARELVDEIGDPLLQARVETARALCAFLLGQVTKALGLSDAAERLYRAHVHSGSELRGEYYLRFTAQAAHIGSLFQLGKIQQASDELRQAVRHAQATENRTALLHLAMVCSLDDIGRGNAQRARERLDVERSQLPQRGFGPLQLLHMVAVMWVGCALSDYVWTERILAEMWPRFEHSLMRHSVFALLAYGAHSRVLLNQHVVERRAGDARVVVRRDMQAMKNASRRLSPATYTRPVARLEYLCGQRERAVVLYREHVEACLHAEYQVEAERARWALGRVRQGDEGAALCAGAIHRLRELGIADPAAELPTHFPELGAGF